MPTIGSVVRAIRIVREDNADIERYMSKRGVTFNKAIHEILRDYFKSERQMTIENFIESGEKVTDAELGVKRYEYEKLRLKLPKILGRKCCMCGSEEGVEYHHRKPLQYGGTNDLNNIYPLCHKCHKEVHRTESEVLRLKRENEALREKRRTLKKALAVMGE